MAKKRFHSLKVKELVKETSDCTSIAFELTDELQDTFQYKQGQYLTLRRDINGEDVRRSYSLCSSPLDGEMRVAVKKIEEGKFSTFANDVLKEGDTLDVMPPMGNFYTDLSPNQAKSYVAFAAGSGITPMMSIIKTTLQTEPNSEFTLLYGNRNVHSIIFKEEIEGLKNQYLNRFQVYHFLTREMQDIPLFNGRFDEEKINTIFNGLIDTETIDEYFLCGPEEMILATKKILESKKVDSKKIHFELFTSPDAKKGVVKKKVSKKRDGKVSLITIKDSGTRYQFELSQGTNNILDAAMLNGADLPFACKGGVCCTCKAKLIEGKVEMDVNYALEPEEVEQGYILTCQSHPLTETVVIDFDEAM
ncbi:MAG: ring-1,2-phenylacetyl-CoA epoxidase subunit PaaE [Maribacter sp.]|jgi:ring-1,2-phenylacetyl-CoA epoxidase subunit PaaE